MSKRRGSSPARLVVPEQAPNGSESLSSRLLKAQDDERRRISRELHDSVGQSLAAVKMNLERIAQLLPGSSEARGDISECIETVDRAANEVRTVSYLLHPPLLELAGLSSAIRWYAEGFAKRSGIDVAVDTPDLPRLGNEYETALFRVVQECLTNVHKYSGASRAEIFIRSDSRRLQLEVTDNGKGIAKTKLAGLNGSSAVGVGIAGMYQRMKELGGRLEIKSGGWGTTVVATLPGFDVQPREPEFAGSSSGLTPLPGSSLNPARILIVDDHELIRRGVRSLLAREPAVAVCGEAVGVADAIDKVNKLSPDLILLDLHLPDGNGWRIVREIQKLGHSPKIIVLTAYDYAGIAETARSANCERFICKTNAHNELLPAIRAVLNREGTVHKGHAATAAAAR